MLAPDTDPADLAGLEIVDSNGERIGRVRQVYPDAGELGWAGVRGNLIGTTEALVPLDEADLDDDVISVPITRARFLSAPRRTPDAPMDDDEREALRRFYAEHPAPRAAAAAAVATDDEEAAAAADDRAPLPARRIEAPSAAAADDGDGIETREQRMTTAVEAVPRTRVVLRKVVVTEERTETVTVRREELRVVREPIEDGEPVSDDVFDGGEQELVLHEERVVVTTEVVPVERIRLVREVLSSEQQITGETWREQVSPGEEPVAG